TSYWPGVGNGGSRRGNTRSPGTRDTAPNTSPYICSVEGAASCQSLATRPPKPPHVVVNDQVKSVSGKDVIAFTTCRCSWLVAANVESGDASKKRLMWLCPSTGASACREIINRGHEAAMISSAAATMPQRISSA